MRESSREPGPGYWLLTAALVVLAVLSALSIGGLLLLAALTMLVVGLRRS